MAKRTSKPTDQKQSTVFGDVGHEAVLPLKRAEDGRLRVTNTEGAPSAKAAQTAEPNPSEGAQSSTNVTGDVPEVQTTEAGQAADAGKTAPASAAATDDDVSRGLPSVDAPNTAEPEPTSVVEGAPSSSAEASAAAAQATETGEAVGQAVTGDLPAAATDSQASEAEALRKRISDAFDELKTKTIRITSRIEGFRRAGMRHSKTPTDHPFDAFTAEQLNQLETEPNLKVEYL